MAKINALELANKVGVNLEPPLLNPDQKMAIGISKVPLEVTKVLSGLLGDHGEFWQFTAKNGDYTFRFNMSDPMDGNASDETKAETLALYEALKAATDEGDTVDGIVLNYIEWRGGNPFFKLEVSVPPTLPSPAVQESLPI